MNYQPTAIVSQRQLADLDFEGLVSVGIEAREMYDKSRWIFGECARVIKTKYGEAFVEKFASTIGIGKESIDRYRIVCERIPTPVRKKYQKLSWSHFRAVASQKNPEKWLKKADDDNWSVERLQVEIKKEKLGDETLIIRPKLVRCDHCARYKVADPEDPAWCKNPKH